MQRLIQTIKGDKVRFLVLGLLALFLNIYIFTVGYPGMTLIERILAVPLSTIVSGSIALAIISYILQPFFRKADGWLGSDGKK
ncbi:MAG TPA: hypothetical protein VIJ29_03240 [Candidatus Paceibacterota bacterium]